MRGPKLPITLWGYVLGELLRLVALTGAVLVTVVAFAAAVKPLADGKLAASDVLKFVFLAIPPMLAYALPFAAGFAATLVYHRLASDNEFQAAAAGGVSHRKMLVPAVLTGLALSGGLIFMNEQVIPNFLRAMQRVITADVPRLLAANISKGRSLTISGMMVYADQVRQAEPGPNSGATDVLQMNRLAAIWIDEQGRVSRETLASRAGLWVFPGDGSPAESESGRARTASSVVMRLEDVAAAERNQALARTRSLDVAWLSPDAFKDDPKFLDWRTLRSLADEPERMNWVEIRRRELAFQLARRAARDEIRAALATSQRVAFTNTLGEAVVIRAAGLREGTPAAFEPLRPGGPIEIELRRKGAAPGAAAGVVTVRARSATLEIDLGPDRYTRRLRFHVEFQRASGAEDPAAAGATPSGSAGGGFALTELSLEAAAVDPLLKMSSRELLAKADAAANKPAPSAKVPPKDAARDEELASAAADLRKGLKDVDEEILAKINERWALGLSCLLMVVTGAVMALKFARHLPLTVYLWSFFPALACVITISGGQHMIRDVGAPGMILCWSGIVALGVFTLVVFRQVARH